MHQQPRTIDPPGKSKSSSRSAHVCSVSGRTSNMAAVSHPGANRNSTHLARTGTVLIWRPKESGPPDWIKTRAVPCRGAHSRDELELSANPGTFRCFAPEARSRYVVRLSRVHRAATDHTARKAAARAIRRGQRLPSPVGWSYPTIPSRPVGLHHRGLDRRRTALDVAAVLGAASRGNHRRHPLCHQLVEVGHALVRCVD